MSTEVSSKAKKKDSKSTSTAAVNKSITSFFQSKSQIKTVIELRDDASDAKSPSETNDANQEEDDSHGKSATIRANGFSIKDYPHNSPSKSTTSSISNDEKENFSQNKAIINLDTTAASKPNEVRKIQSECNDHKSQGSNSSDSSDILLPCKNSDDSVIVLSDDDKIGTSVESHSLKMDSAGMQQVTTDNFNATTNTIISEPFMETSCESPINQVNDRNDLISSVTDRIDSTISSAPVSVEQEEICKTVVIPEVSTSGRPRRQAVMNTLVRAATFTTTLKSIVQVNPVQAQKRRNSRSQEEESTGKDTFIDKKETEIEDIDDDSRNGEEDDNNSDNDKKRNRQGRKSSNGGSFSKKAKDRENKNSSVKKTSQSTFFMSKTEKKRLEEEKIKQQELERQLQLEEEERKNKEILAEKEARIKEQFKLDLVKKQIERQVLFGNGVNKYFEQTFISTTSNATAADGSSSSSIIDVEMMCNIAVNENEVLFPIQHSIGINTNQSISHMDNDRYSHHHTIDINHLLESVIDLSTITYTTSEKLYDEEVHLPEYYPHMMSKSFALDMWNKTCITYLMQWCMDQKRGDNSNERKSGTDKVNKALIDLSQEGHEGNMPTVIELDMTESTVTPRAISPIQISSNTNSVSYADTYQPQCMEEYAVSQQTCMKEVYNWLKSWSDYQVSIRMSQSLSQSQSQSSTHSNKRQKQSIKTVSSSASSRKRYMNDDSDEDNDLFIDDDEFSDDDEYEYNDINNENYSDRGNFSSHILVLEGVTGCGKTSGVYTLAKELNFNVIEINSTQDRKLSDLKTLVTEASQSRSFGTMEVNGNPISLQSTTSQSRTLMTSSQSSNSQILSYPYFNTSTPQTPVSLLSNQVSSDMMHNLILFDEVDVDVQDDSCLSTTLISLLKQARCPIILTCEAYEQRISYLNTLQPYVITMIKPTMTECRSVITQVITDRLSPTMNISKEVNVAEDDNMVKLIQLFIHICEYDIRFMMNYLQSFIPYAIKVLTNEPYVKDNSTTTESMNVHVIPLFFDICSHHGHQHIACHPIKVSNASSTVQVTNTQSFLSSPHDIKSDVSSSDLPYTYILLPVVHTIFPRISTLNDDQVFTVIGHSFLQYDPYLSIMRQCSNDGNTDNSMSNPINVHKYLQSLGYCGIRVYINQYECTDYCVLSDTQIQFKLNHLSSILLPGIMTVRVVLSSYQYSDTTTTTTTTTIADTSKSPLQLSLSNDTTGLGGSWIWIKPMKFPALKKGISAISGSTNTMSNIRKRASPVKRLSKSRKKKRIIRRKANSNNIVNQLDLVVSNVSTSQVNGDENNDTIEGRRGFNSMNDDSDNEQEEEGGDGDMAEQEELDEDEDEIFDDSIGESHPMTPSSKKDTASSLLLSSSDRNKKRGHRMIIDDDEDEDAEDKDDNHFKEQGLVVECDNGSPINEICDHNTSKSEQVIKDMTDAVTNDESAFDVHVSDHGSQIDTTVDSATAMDLSIATVLIRSHSTDDIHSTQNVTNTSTALMTEPITTSTLIQPPLSSCSESDRNKYRYASLKRKDWKSSSSSSLYPGYEYHYSDTITILQDNSTNEFGDSGDNDTDENNMSSTADGKSEQKPLSTSFVCIPAPPYFETNEEKQDYYTQETLLATHLNDISQNLEWWSISDIFDSTITSIHGIVNHSEEIYAEEGIIIDDMDRTCRLFHECTSYIQATLFKKDVFNTMEIQKDRMSISDTITQYMCNIDSQLLKSNDDRNRVIDGVRQDDSNIPRKVKKSFSTFLEEDLEHGDVKNKRNRKKTKTVLEDDDDDEKDDNVGDNSGKTDSNTVVATHVHVTETIETNENKCVKDENTPTIYNDAIKQCNKSLWTYLWLQQDYKRSVYKWLNQTYLYDKVRRTVYRGYDSQGCIYLGKDVILDYIPMMGRIVQAESEYDTYRQLGLIQSADRRSGRSSRRRESETLVKYQHITTAIDISEIIEIEKLLDYGFIASYLRSNIRTSLLNDTQNKDDAVPWL